MSKSKKTNESDKTKQEKSSKLEEVTMLAEERLTQLKYLQADFENYKKSFEREKFQIIEVANKSLMTDMLPIIDDCARAITQLKEEEKEGMQMMYDNLLKILGSHGLKKMDVIGEKLDTNYHQVLMKEKSDQEEGTITEELQVGFMLKSMVLRPAGVKVSGGK